VTGTATTAVDGFRSYEVYQRLRPGQTTEFIRPRELTSDAYLLDPYPIVGVLRRHTACYRDWPGNAFWITRYDDVTSVFADDANVELRTRLWASGRSGWGADLAAGLAAAPTDGVAVAVARCVERAADEHGERIVRRSLADAFDAATAGAVDLARHVFARLPFELLCAALGVEGSVDLARAVLAIRRAPLGEPVARAAGSAALDELATLLEPAISEHAGADDLLGIAAGVGASGRDVAATVLELDHETLHGLLANLWFHLLIVPERIADVRSDPLVVRSAVLETLRHSPPIVSTDVWTRHEVERFGCLLPDGALLRLSAAAANRDPTVFSDPDTFDPHRADLCRREPRGQYRADGLPSGISFGTGRPSKHPAVPEDRPRSSYAITRDLACTTTSVLLDELPVVGLAPGTVPTLRSLRLGEMHTCWTLPVVAHDP
jgi:pulcherriminic acid synthase